MEIFLYICNMENEEDLSDWIEIDSDEYGERVLNGVFGIDNPPLSAYWWEIESVQQLVQMGIHVTFYNRNKIVHPYGK